MNFLFPGKHHVARAALAAEARLVHAIERHADLAAFQDILDVPVLRRFLDRTLNQRLGPTQEALAVLETLAARIQAPVDDVNAPPSSSASAGLFYAHVPLDEPADLHARCSRAPPCARRTRRASSRSRRPSSSQRRSPEAGPRPARISASRSLRGSFRSWSSDGFLPPFWARDRSENLTTSLRKSFGLAMPAGFSILVSS